ncbi:hypothetical protein N8814_01315 [Acidimicrobiia bacterium]|nr:hypothetical protein [Acidimicrobiia bacterium]
MNKKVFKFRLSNLLLVVFLIVYFLLLIKLQKIDKTILLSQDVFIQGCSKYTIFYLIENLFNFQSSQLTFIELSLKSSTPGKIINFDELICIGRNIEISSDAVQTIMVGSDSFFGDYFYVCIKTLLFLFLIFSKNQWALFLNVLFDFLYLALMPLAVSFTIQFYSLLIVYGFIILKRFSHFIPELKEVYLLQKKIVLIYLVSLFSMIAYKIHTVDYMIGYWLANYKYGFIKRGMVGHLLYSISKLSENFNLVTVINIFILLLYVALFYYVYYFFNSQKQNYLSYLLLFSPALLSFFIIDDVLVGRPEILGVLTYLFLYKNYSKKNNYTYLFSILFFLISFFSHSINVFIALVAIIFLIRQNNFKFNLILNFQILLMLIAVLIFVFAFISNTDTQHIEQSLCIDAQNLDIRSNICDGAIGWLNLSAESNINMIGFWKDSNQRFYKSYPLVFTIALLPLLKSRWLKANIKFFVAISFGFLPIFYLAYDWGRYFWVFLFLITHMFFYESNEEIIELTSLKTYTLLLFASLWYVPGARGIRWDNWSQNLSTRVLVSYFFIFLIIGAKVRSNEQN